VEKRTRELIAVAVAIGVVAAGTAAYVLLVPPPSSVSSSTFVAPAECTAAGEISGGNWTTYHQDNARDGDAQAGPFTSAHSLWAAPAVVDGQVYAEPLACGNAVFVATENDSIYAFNASTGVLLWKTHLGTPVAGSSLPCGDISPSGITGTPVVDVPAGLLYAVAFLAPAQHVLFAIYVENGTIASHAAVDPSGAVPTAEQQRGALALVNGVVYIPFGGLFGDCGDYHGWVVGVPTAGLPALSSYQVPTHREGGIWATAGVTPAPNGSLFVATGNGDSTTTFDFGDSVIALSPSLAETGYFAPTNWAQLNGNDTDLGSLAPTLLPNGDAFQVGKAGVGYLLAASHLGGIGGEIAETNVCGGAYGGTARVGLSVFVPCLDGLAKVVANSTGLSVAWHTGSFDAGSPIVTGSVVWAVNISTAVLLGFNLTTGATLLSVPLGGADHFISPAAGPGTVYVAGGSELYAFALG
jgi:polyvinyl alcohol dehydrogenase (cytochrome)